MSLQTSSFSADDATCPQTEGLTNSENSPSLIFPSPASEQQSLTRPSPTAQKVIPTQGLIFTLTDEAQESAVSASTIIKKSSDVWPPAGIDWYYSDESCAIACSDCREILPSLPKVDLVLTDPPYGITACAWDSVIPLEQMWANLHSIAFGAIVLFASQPFTSALVMSNPAAFKHEWIWAKNAGSNFANLDYCPMKEHESILVFSSGALTFNPQMEDRKGGGLERSRYAYSPSNTGKREGLGGFTMSHAKHNGQNPERFPSSVQRFNRERGLHPNQKPLGLLNYLIRTYSNTTDLILDFTCGSGTTLLAAKDLGRKAIGIEIEERYCEIAANRLRQEVLQFA